VFRKYFAALRDESACQYVTDACDLYDGLKRFPKDSDNFQPSLRQSHPGSQLNSDVIKRAGQMILVTADLFSDYTTATFTQSESHEDMKNAQLNTVTPIRHSHTLLILVDRSPTLKSLASREHEDLKLNGISLQLSDSFNKNLNCRVDKRIQELEKEILRIVPHETKLTVGQLSKAVNALNNTRVRGHNLTAAELHFSRDGILGENLELDDHRFVKQSVSSKPEDRQQ
jgi:hypothetical protein